MNNEFELSKRLAPEDVLIGQFIAVFSATHVRYPYSWDASDFKPPQPMRYTCLECADGEPLLVVAVCLPFVMVIDREGDQRTIDLRQQSLVQLSEFYGLEAFTRPEKASKDED
jgi:hypothetical protein